MSGDAAAFRLEMLGAGGESIPVVRRGPAGGAATVLFLPPLFEEMNRSRRLLAQTGAALAEAGIASVLPDLPGTGDHPDALPDWERWRAAARALGEALGADGPVDMVAFRGGALLADAVPARSAYLFAPANGASLWRGLLRTRAAADAEEGAVTTPALLEAQSDAGETLELGGYLVPPPLAVVLRAAQVRVVGIPVRNVMLGAVAAAGADAALPGPPVWLQAEAEDSRALAKALADDIGGWLRWNASPS